MRRDAARIFDEYLVSAARSGDRNALARLAARWQVRLLKHAYRLTGDAERARDVAQESWGDICKGVSRLNDAAHFPAWAYRIVTRRAADAIRRLRSERKLNAAYSAEMAAAPVATQSPDAEIAERSAPLAEAIARLPPDQRAAIALFYGEDLSIAEIAAALQIPPGTVKTRLMHARRKLRAHLEGEPSDDGS